MMPRAMQRSGLPLFILAAVIFAAAIGVVFLVANPFAEGGLFDRSSQGSRQPAPPEPVSQEQQAPADEPEPAAQPAPAPAQEPQPAPEAPSVSQPAESAPAAASRHTVVRGDTLFDLAGRYWSDPYLWPLILSANQQLVRDPDYLRQGSVLEIPASPLVNGALPADRVAEVTRAHILAHQRYKALGNESLAAGRENGNPWLIQRGLIRVNKAHWVLYSGLRYDPDLLDHAEGLVSADDVRVVREFIVRFGPRPGGR